MVVSFSAGNMVGTRFDESCLDLPVISSCSHLQVRRAENVHGVMKLPEGGRVISDSSRGRLSMVVVDLM